MDVLNLDLNTLTGLTLNVRAWHSYAGLMKHVGHELEVRSVKSYIMLKCMTCATMALIDVTFGNRVVFKIGSHAGHEIECSTRDGDWDVSLECRSCSAFIVGFNMTTVDKISELKRRSYDWMKYR